MPRYTDKLTTRIITAFALPSNVITKSKETYFVNSRCNICGYEFIGFVERVWHKATGNYICVDEVNCLLRLHAQDKATKEAING